jgi:predicted GIY-YIG superfamily endonuclease
VIVHIEEYQTKSEAIKRETQLKFANGRAFAWDIIRQKSGSLDG